MNLQLIKHIDRYAGISLCNILGSFKPGPKDIIQNPKKILIMKFSGFGNIVLALPTIRAIKTKFPNSEITFLTHTINKAVIDKEPSINNVMTFDLGGTYQTFTNIFALFKKIRKEQFDIIFDLEQFSRFSSIISFLGKFSVGFDTEGQGRSKVYDIKVKYNNNQHTSKTFANIGESVGAKINFNDKKVNIINEDQNKIDFISKKYSLSRKDKLIGIHPGCGVNNPKRRWQKKKFAKLADFLVDNYNCKVFFTGTGKEKELIKEIQSLMHNKSIDLSDNLNLRELAEFMSRCKFFVSNDTGPLHLASAMNVPVVSFFGPNTPLLYGPLGKNNLIFYKNMHCSPCTTNFNEKSTKCKHFKCINDISFEEVRDKIKDSNLIK